MKRIVVKIALCAFLPALLAGCIKKSSALDIDDSAGQTEYVNTFAYNSMSTFYLWIGESSVQKEMSSWRTDADPIKKVAAVRYKDSSGNDIDRWTQLTDDYDAFVSSVEGVSTTFGYDFILMYTDSSQEYVAAVVTFVYADSPASTAGLKRGDVIITVDGEPIPASNYYEIVNSKLLNSTSCTIGLWKGGNIKLSAVTMYCNPVNVVKVFDCAGKKVGYLHFTSFTPDACPDLITACNTFKKEGVSELVLDLRYNGGGYVTTEQLLASMLAPQEEVSKGSLFEMTVYNELLTEEWGADSNTYFKTSFEVNEKELSTAMSNIGITKLYALISSGSASASEALICGLKPYLDITMIGTQTHGKFCEGIIMEGPAWYNMYKNALSSSTYSNGVKYTDNWGIYLMIGRYADKNGQTLSMPSGLTPDIEAEDNPLDGYQLGDPNETLLKQALTLAGYSYLSTSGTKTGADTASLESSDKLRQPRGKNFGIYIDDSLIME